MKKIIFILFCLFILFSLGIAQKPKIEFDSVLSSAQYVPAVEKEYKGIWILKFENGTVVPIIQDKVKQIKETIWFIGKKYRVWQKLEESVFNFKAELIELTGIAAIDEKVKQRLAKQKKK